MYKIYNSTHLQKNNCQKPVVSEEYTVAVKRDRQLSFFIADSVIILRRKVHLVAFIGIALPRLFFPPINIIKININMNAIAKKRGEKHKIDRTHFSLSPPL
mmetsp:Transcript_6764/g.7233  ORF Transcript_6764/g.7233 Transcript_6764/m.7233 type:complete len:101 (-) Transcript_6764:216-518(-)